MDVIFSGVSIPAIITLSITILISALNAYKSSFSFYWDISSSLIILLTFLIGCITSPRATELLYISIP